MVSLPPAAPLNNRLVSFVRTTDRWYLYLVGVARLPCPVCEREIVAMPLPKFESLPVSPQRLTTGGSSYRKADAARLHHDMLHGAPVMVADGLANPPRVAGGSGGGVEH